MKHIPDFNCKIIVMSHCSSIHMYNFSMGIQTIDYDYDEDLFYQRPERIQFRGKLEPMDIKVFDPYRQVSHYSEKNPSPCGQNNGGCSHLCLSAPIPQGFRCSCPTGIVLVDNTTCAEEFSEILVLAKRNGLVKMSLDTPDFTDVAIPLKGDDFFMVRTGDADTAEDDDDSNVWDFNAVAVDFNPVKRHVYWTDQSKGIFRTELDGRSGH